MKALIPAALIVFMALPASAFERMLRSDCQESFTRIAALNPDPDADQDTAVADIVRAFRVTPDGWCQFEVRSGMDDLDFDVIEWRMDGTKRWTRDGIPPLALQVRIEGLDPDQMQASDPTNRPAVDVDVTLRQVPDAGLVVVESAKMQNSAGDELLVSGVFERVFLSSPSMMQVSMGSATFKAGLMSLTLEGTHENPFGFNGSFEMNGTPQAQVDAAFEAISSLPDGVIDDASRAELTAFAGDLPKPVGTLEVSLASERGLGLMQVIMSVANGAMDAFENGGENLASQMEILFDGLTLSADWTPDAQNAD